MVVSFELQITDEVRDLCPIPEIQKIIKSFKGSNLSGSETVKDRIIILADLINLFNLILIRLVSHFLDDNYFIAQKRRRANQITIAL